MSFEVETVYDRATIHAFQDILNRTVRAKRIRLVRIVCAVIGCISLAYGALWLWATAAADTGTTTLFPALSSLVAGVIFLLLSAFYQRYINRHGKHMVDQHPSAIRYLFDERGYTTQTGKSKTRSSYGIIQSICCNEDYYVLMLNRRQGFVLDKRHFLRGDAEAFAPFLERQTGRQLQRAQG